MTGGTIIGAGVHVKIAGSRRLASAPHCGLEMQYDFCASDDVTSKDSKSMF